MLQVRKGSQRAEVTMGNGSQGIKAKQEFNFMSGEKVEMVRLFIQKNWAHFLQGFLRNFKTLLAKTKAKNSAAQSHCLKQGLAICHRGKADFKIFHHCEIHKPSFSCGWSLSLPQKWTIVYLDATSERLPTSQVYKKGGRSGAQGWKAMLLF